jgi:predicted AlkP superfamily phosphohydrolase/phosphomutase
VSPLNLDPEAPALPISTPDSYAAELARASGRFYTQGMPEDTKALNEGVFTPEEFLAQARLAGQEVIDQYRRVLGDFRAGLLFYYFGNLDQVSHMMWRPMDPQHPAYDPERDGPFREVVTQIYAQLDGVVGETLERMGPETLLVVMSDHGFTSWRRAFHLNTWLKENGYLALLDPRMRDDPGLYANVDWSRTRAYGLGLNGLYINIRGRERFGSVDPQERQALMDEIAGRLLQAVDPATGQPAVTKAYKREEAYHDRGALEIGPDLVVGYAKGTRGSNQSALGKVGPDVFTDNTEMWSGDHCMDHESVPGVLFASRPLRKPVAELKELAAGILAEFDIEGFPSRPSAAGAQPQTP